MGDNRTPETLQDLLQTLERSQDLRAFARECGLTVRELRKRLANWRRELKSAATGRQSPGAGGDPDRSVVADHDDLLDLPPAADLSESPLPAAGSAILEVFTDGASRGNPGPAAIGVLFRQHEGPDLCVHAEAIGRATNNQAEYRAVLAALQHSRRWGVGRVHLYLDSELVARQMMGIYRVKSHDLLPLYQQVMHLARQLTEIRVRHVPRAQNRIADQLANKALDASGR
jgi:ribonuclease HI/probable phosphoglycerate mutase